MTRKNVGLNKGKVIRIHENAKKDLLIIKKELNMSSRDTVGDVVSYLVKMYKEEKIGNIAHPTMDDYKPHYQEQVNITQRWKKRFEKACEIGNLNPVELMT